MTDSKKLNLLSPDKAESDPAHDGLGYAPFAKHLATSITRMAPIDGLVLAIYGQWGSGKTTLLNFVVHYLEHAAEDQRPVIVHFNPWWFSGHEDLTRRFFDQLQATLNKRHDLGKQLRERIAGFADLLAETPLPYASAAKAVAKVARPVPEDVPALKESIANELIAQKIKILVIMDDIDRLTGEEIRQLFRVIKAVGDFPNLIYLLAFDKEIVVKAVQQIQDLPGEAYLEKIVQVPFELPLPDRDALRQLMSSKFTDIFGEILDELVDQDYLLRVFIEGVDKFIHTPRDIVRLANTLSVTYPAVEGEVNPVDFFAIQALQVFRPQIYDLLRKNREIFAGHASDVAGAYGSYRNDALKQFLEGFIEQVSQDERENIKKFLMLLFPKLQSVWQNTWYGAESTGNWRKQLRVCSPDLFDIYFRLAIPEANITNTEIKRIIALMSDEDRFRTTLLEYNVKRNGDGTTKARSLLERFEDFTTKEIAADAIPSVINVLLDVGDQLRLANKKRGVLDFGIERQIGRILIQLLRRLDEADRFLVLKQAITNGKAVATIVEEVMTLAQQHGKYSSGEPEPESEWIINSTHLSELEQCALERIQNSAAQKTLLQAPFLSRVLYFWREHGGSPEASQWVQTTMETDTGLLALLESFLGRNYSQTIGSYGQKTHYRLDPEWFASYVDVGVLMAKIEGIAGGDDLSENQRLAIRRIGYEHNLRQQGKNPDSFIDDDD